MHPYMCMLTHIFLCRPRHSSDFNERVRSFATAARFQWVSRHLRLPKHELIDQLHSHDNKNMTHHAEPKSAHVISAAIQFQPNFSLNVVDVARKL